MRKHLRIFYYAIHITFKTRKSTLHIFGHMMCIKPVKTSSLRGAIATKQSKIAAIFGFWLDCFVAYAPLMTGGVPKLISVRSKGVILLHILTQGGI